MQLRAAMRATFPFWVFFFLKKKKSLMKVGHPSFSNVVKSILQMQPFFVLLFILKRKGCGFYTRSSSMQQSAALCVAQKPYLLLIQKWNDSIVCVIVETVKKY